MSHHCPDCYCMHCGRTRPLFRVTPHPGNLPPVTGCADCMASTLAALDALRARVDAGEDLETVCKDAPDALRSAAAQGEAAARARIDAVLDGLPVRTSHPAPGITVVVPIKTTTKGKN